MSTDFITKSEIERLRTINAELLAALERSVSVIQNAANRLPNVNILLARELQAEAMQGRVAIAKAKEETT